MTAPPTACRIPFLVTTASSEDDMHPALQLQVRDTSSSQGWQSSKLCEYPQDLVLMVNYGTPTRIATIQLLVHHTKIPSRIDVWIAETAPSKLRKLGYVLLDSNDASKHTARELKSVAIDCDVAYLKLSLHQCHRNRFNLFDQVGLVDVALLAPPSHHSPPKPHLNPIQLPTNQSPKSPRSSIDPATLELYHIPHPSHGGTRLSLRHVIEALRIQRAASVDAEDYAAANAIKDLERTVCQCLAQLEWLHQQKNDVLRVENYDAATLLKTEIDQVLHRVAGIAAKSNSFGPQVLHESNAGSRTCSPKKRRDQASPPKAVHATMASRQSAIDVQLAAPPTEPEPLESKLGLACVAVAGLLAIDDRTLCSAYSQHRTLREPAVVSVVQALQRSLSKSCDGQTAPEVATSLEKLVLPWLASGILQQPHHAFSTGCAFAVAAIASLQAAASATAPSPVLEARDRQLVPPLVAIFIQRLGDPSSKVRNKAGVSMLEIAHTVGPQHVLACVLAFCQSAVATTVHWRHLYSLVRTVTALLEAYECPFDAKDIRSIVDFVQAQNGFDHSMAQVTEVATQFAVALYHKLGSTKADEHLACLDAAKRATYKRIVQDDEWYQPSA